MNALALIGNTPLVELSGVYRGPGKILAKAEFVQPGGSVKDRAGRKAIEMAYADGRLTQGQTVVEMTSGNMGAALAVVCAVTQNPFVAVMPAGNSPERARMMRGLGAEVVVTPQVDGTPGKVTGKDIEAALERARGIARERNGFLVDQFRNPATFLAHEETTGPEIWAETRGEVDAFVAMVGSGGTFVGTSRFLKGRNPAIVCGAVEPEGAEFLAGKTVAKPAHLLQGAGYAMTPLDWPDGLADLFLAVSDAEAGEMRVELGRREGLYVGFTAAANVCAARKLLKSGRLRSEAMVVTILCDTGLKYTG